ncbi:MAG: hypothetical protein JWN38_87 [Candidatus Saccharibacteria bacterium]|nr:hypothetical protein [Candidatus Saccharibacteria bacterium]
MSNKARYITLGVFWALPVGFYVVVWFILKVFFHGAATNIQGWDQFFMANFWHGHFALWLFLFIWLTISLIGWAASSYGSHQGYGSRRERAGDTGTHITAGVMVLILVVSIFQMFNVGIDNDKDAANFLNRATVFYAPDINHVPESLNRLVSNAKTGDKNCQLVGSHDVPSCINQGTLATTGWDARIGSFDGAKVALRQASADVQKVSLDESTVTYLNASDGQPARWSGILDGNGKHQAMGGVAEWAPDENSNNVPTKCEFTGNYAINRAFGGSHMNALNSLVAEKYPSMRFDIGDVWGYCKSTSDPKVTEPIVVIPMTRQVNYEHRTVDTAAGVVLVQGDHGKTKLTYDPQVKPGELPGPAYPMSLAASQRVDVKWAAGRSNMNTGGFGYEPTTLEAQAGNVSEFLLRNKATGRLEYVTPLTLRSSTSEVILAYTIIDADAVNSGDLNQLSVYVLADNDPRRVNLQRLEADAHSYLGQANNSFFNSGGQLLEFTPVDGDVWRAFGEQGNASGQNSGQVVYRLDISATRKIQTTLVSLTPDVSSGANTGTSTSTSPTGGTTVSGNACGQSVDQLSTAQLTACLREFADALDGRQNSSPGK